MVRFYKYNIEYITEHAVDPDKRRYATKHEAVRHYIDIDHWGKYPFPEVPRDWLSVLVKYTTIYAINAQGDTLRLERDTRPEVEAQDNFLSFRDSLVSKSWLIDSAQYRNFYRTNILANYYEDDWIVDCDSLQKVFGQLDCQSAFAKDHFSEYGILPYHLLQMQHRLTEAFRRRNVNSILRLSAEMGHYIGDAHVPLHTTENYNGQLTNQVGIHGFWESRIPELFADDTYDFFVGHAEYLDDPASYFWNVVLDSHQLVDSVLLIERELSLTFPSDQQYCFEERLDNTIRTQCTAYAAAFQERMAGMVEKRMQQSILAVGSSWYTAWVDAGQPDMNNLQQRAFSRGEFEEQQELEKQFQQGENKGRTHD
ncbi:MAG: hypothetical protein DHS20C18_12330 [Saprospiraceae bacterium]|nr:MAG: hypothetical protein DHS20C18_12330 [Saprospiraceae bacterium]